MPEHADPYPATKPWFCLSRSVYRQSENPATRGQWEICGVGVHWPYDAAKAIEIDDFDAPVNRTGLCGGSIAIEVMKNSVIKQYR